MAKIEQIVNTNPPKCCIFLTNFKTGCNAPKCVRTITVCTCCNNIEVVVPHLHMKIGSQTCPFETFTEGNDKAKFCNKFSKYIEGVCKDFLTQTIFA